MLKLLKGIASKSVVILSLLAPDGMALCFVGSNDRQFISFHTFQIESSIREQLLNDVRNYSIANNKSSVDYLQVKVIDNGISRLPNLRMRKIHCTSDFSNY